MMKSSRRPDRATEPFVASNRRLWPWIAVLLIAAAFAFAFKASARMPDFEVYWRAASRALAGEPLYRPEDGHWLFKYFPVFAVVAMPIALVPLQVAKAIWFMGSVLTLVILLRTSITLLPELRKPRWALVTFTVVVLGKFYAHELVLGQTNLLFVTVVTGALLAFKGQREALAGALIVVAIILKPYAVILLPWLLARRQPRSIASAAIGMTAALALPAARYGFVQNLRLHLDWWHTVITSTAPNLLNTDNVSWLAMYSRWFHPGASAGSLTLATTLVVFVAVVWFWVAGRNLQFPEGLEGGLLLTLMPLLSPQGWDYVLLVSTPAVMYLVNYEERLPRAARAITITALAVVGLSIFDLLGRRAYYAFMRMSGITLCFFIIIGALMMLRRRHVA